MLDWLPKNISTFGGDIDGLMYLIYYVVGVWFIIAEGVLFYFIFKYRKKEGVRASYITGSSLKACSIILILSGLVLACDLAIDFDGTPAWVNIKQTMPEPDNQVKIQARQFAWNFKHAGADGKLDTADDIATNGALHCKVGDKIRFELTSKDVIHSFWSPYLRLKQDVVPGRMIPGWFEATETGVYQIGCAELCGTGHGIMLAHLIVHTEDEWNAWLASQQ